MMSLRLINVINALAVSLVLAVCLGLILLLTPVAYGEHEAAVNPGADRTITIPIGEASCDAHDTGTVDYSVNEQGECVGIAYDITHSSGRSEKLRIVRSACSGPYTVALGGAGSKPMEVNGLQVTISDVTEGDPYETSYQIKGTGSIQVYHDYYTAGGDRTAANHLFSVDNYPCYRTTRSTLTVNVNPAARPANGNLPAGTKTTETVTINDQNHQVVVYAGENGHEYQFASREECLQYYPNGLGHGAGSC